MSHIASRGMAERQCARVIVAACVWTRAEKDVTAELRRNGLRAYYPQETVDRLIMGRKRRSEEREFSIDATAKTKDPAFGVKVVANW